MLHMIHINVLLFILGLVPSSVPDTQKSQQPDTSVQVVDTVDKEQSDSSKNRCRQFPDCLDAIEQ